MKIFDEWISTLSNSRPKNNPHLPSDIDELHESTTDKTSDDEWIWVEGYKGVYKDMTAHGDFKYELGKQYDIPEGEEIKECKNGFHFCLNLRDVYKHYPIGNGNRFFKVRALVRNTDVANYGKPEPGWGFYHAINKLAAKSIILTDELTIDEIFESYGYITLEDGWTEKYKKLAIELGIDATRRYMYINNLEALGYSSTFAKLICSMPTEYYDRALAVGSQSDLSMDMKVWVIFNANS